MGLKYDMGKCVDCGSTRKVLRSEWIKAAQPRCYKCGGRVEPSAAAHEEHVIRNDVKKGRLERADFNQ